MLVPGNGPLTAKIVFVGEAPGVEEELCGIPFVGSSGKLLNSMLTNVGIVRADCYFTNVVKTRPPRNDFGVFYEDPRRTTPSPMLSESCRQLHNELRGLRPNVIVPLGGESLRAITGKRSIDSWRGSILPSPFREDHLGKIISTYHPARILRVYSEIGIFHHDLERVKEECESPNLNLPELLLDLQPTYTTTIDFLKSILVRCCPISFDIETTENHVRCLGISDSPTHAISIPFMSNFRRPYNATMAQTTTANPTTIFLGATFSSSLGSYWELEEEHQILLLLDQIFSSPNIAKYAQNFPFDSQILGREFGFTIRGPIFDTMAASHTLYPELPKGLDFLASMYTRIPYYSDYDSSSDLELWEYNCKDCVVTYQVASVLASDLRGRKTDLFRTSSGGSIPSQDSNLNPNLESNRLLHTSWDFHSNHIEPTIIADTRISSRGILIDQKAREDIRKPYLEKMNDHLVIFQKLAGSPVNPSSPKQMSIFLYTTLHLPVQFNQKTKKPTCDETAIEKLQNKYPQFSHMFTQLLSYRKYHKLISTYIDMPLSPDGRAMTSLSPVGTVTGRCSSQRTIWGYGGNLQNIPVKTDLGKPLRRMFIPDPGYILLKCDLSQAEFRLVVWFANIRRLIVKYLSDSNYDCHRWVASIIYKIVESEVVKSQRDVAKNGVYGGNYRMMPKRAAEVYELELSLATWVLNEYRKAIPEVPLWWKEIESFLNTTRTLTNPLGRKRVFMDRLSDDTYRDAYSHHCQCTVADVIHRAEYLAEIILYHLGCETLLQVHDELVFQCRIDRLNHCLPIIKNIMEYPLTIPGVPEPLIIPADISYGPNWLDTKKWKPGTIVDLSTLLPITEEPTHV